ncbi:hypothetical protein TVAGG3_0013390 [Trichomonas vaginalis G3]|uniref:hypothetical protein n=1 Tax=Trichomonas vaginalis (strain ATCC PRA-98 / G3) TaxID=412133 RepID=UPI0021E610CF|nr:hypothetical protein TVAGG3_0013390 [Trichomonas vaginalis G3]KAI5539264.1 hypothetical protein TVAGG3_0013390 [Trichomonas vaginalis G3]
MTSNWTFSYSATFTYDVRHKDYQILHSYGIEIYYKIDGGGQSYLFSRSNGVWTIGEFEFKLLYENVESSDYINIIYDVTNKGTRSHSLGISSYAGLYIDNQGTSTVINPLEGNLGFEGIYNDHSAKFILRGTERVTDVDTIFYYRTNSDYTLGNLWKNRSSYDTKPVGIDSWFAFSWQNRNFEPEEEKKFSFLIGRGEYIDNYKITLKTPVKDFYPLISAIRNEVSVSSVKEGVKVELFRSTDGVNEEKIDSFTDNGSSREIIDSAPNIPSSGWHTIKYHLTSDKFPPVYYSFRVLSTDKPELEVEGDVKTEYFANEVFPLKVTIYDDSTVFLITREDDTVLENEKVICNGESITKTINITIPNDRVDTVHVFRIRLRDEFNIESDEFSFTYKVVEVRPDIVLSRALRLYYNVLSSIEVSGRFRNFLGPTELCLFTSINGSSPSNQKCESVSDNQFHDFRFYYKITSSIDSINNLTIYCLNSDQTKSNVTFHEFGIISQPILQRMHSCVNSQELEWYVLFVPLIDFS